MYKVLSIQIYDEEDACTTLFLGIIIDANRMAWFHYKDVMRILNIKKEPHGRVSEGNVQRLVELCVFKPPAPYARDMRFINEPGLYQLMCISTRPSDYIDQVQNWLTTYALPTLRDKRSRKDTDFFTQASAYELDDATLRQNGFLYLASTPTEQEKNIFKFSSSVNIDYCLNKFSRITFEEWKLVAAFETNDRFVDYERACKYLEKQLISSDFYRFNSTEDAIQTCKNIYEKIKTRDSTYYYDENMCTQKYNFTC